MKISKDIPFTHTIPALREQKLAETSPITGELQVVRMHPQGCLNLVHVAFGYSGLWVVPSEINQYITLDAAPHEFEVSIPVEKGQYLWVIMRNGDAVNPHTIQVVATIFGDANQ